MTKKVLWYIDDSDVDHTILQYMQREYRPFDYVQHYFDGKAVIEQLKEYCHNPWLLPDVIFIDLYMDRYNGWDFVEELEPLLPYLIKNITVYILSSSINFHDILRAEQSPLIKKFLIKPLTANCLMMLEGQLNDPKPK